MADSCTEIEAVSSEIYKWIRNQSNVGEESITDWALYEISQRIKKSGYKKFNRHQEARKTGADWEWWFVGNKKSLKLRVQAKKVEGKRDVYPSLAYTNKHGLQIEKLINDSKAVNAIPIYALYTAPLTATALKCPNSAKATNEGVYVAEAQFLFDKYIKNGRTIIRPTDILKHSAPLSCLLCCDIGKSANKISNIKSFIHSLSLFGSVINQPDVQVGLHEQLPNYVQSLLNTLGEPINDTFEEEFHNDIEDINALMITDLREMYSEPMIF